MRQYFGFSKQNIIDWCIILFFIVLIASIAAAQNVGIGTSAPSVPLDVFSDNPYITRFNSGSSNMFIGLSENNSIRGYVGSYAGAAEDVDFGTASSNLSGKLHLTIKASPKMTIDPNGNTGIGTTLPAEKLDVAGHVKVSGEIKPGGQSGIVGQVLISNGNGTMSWSSVDTQNPGNYGTVTNPITGKTWLDRNLGASQVATNNTDPASYGHLYQWGRGADGHQIRTSLTTTTRATISIAGVNSSWDKKFITTLSSVPLDWLDGVTQNHMWSGTAAENNPCPSGFRVPTIAEWTQERLTWTTDNATGAFNSVLKLPKAGYRDKDGNVLNEGNVGYYYASTPVGTNVPRGYYLRIQDNSVIATLPANGMEGFCVRCIKD